MAAAPEFCASLLPGLKRPDMKRSRRVRLSDIYLATPHETFARAFECFIADNMNAPSAHTPDTSCERTYPQGAERKALGDVIRCEVISQLQTTTAAHR